MQKMSFAEAKALCSDHYSGFTLISGEERISLPPKYLGHIAQGIRNQLDSNIGFFSENFGGALISYNNIKLLVDKGQIIDDAPFIHFNVLADFVFFKPCVGSLLKGRVNKVGKDHIGLVVHNHFNVSVPISQQQEEQPVAKGDECLFTVTHLYMHRNLLSMEGKHIKHCKA